MRKTFVQKQVAVWTLMRILRTKKKQYPSFSFEVENFNLMKRENSGSLPKQTLFHRLGFAVVSPFFVRYLTWNL